MHVIITQVQVRIGSGGGSLPFVGTETGNHKPRRQGSHSADTSPSNLIGGTNANANANTTNGNSKTGLKNRISTHASSAKDIFGIAKSQQQQQQSRKSGNGTKSDKQVEFMFFFFFLIFVLFFVIY